MFSLPQLTSPPTQRTTGRNKESPLQANYLYLTSTKDSTSRQQPAWDTIHLIGSNL